MTTEKDLIVRKMTRQDLEAEQKEILSWMNNTPHPSQFGGWSDSLSELSKQWSARRRRLEELKNELQ